MTRYTTSGALDELFSDSDSYEPVAITVTAPGKRMFTAEDPDGDRLNVNWEGGDRFSYDQGDRTQPLPEDDPLYAIAADMLDAYPYIVLEPDGSQRYRALSHTNAGGEAARALDEPLEWGVENDYRTWDERQQDRSLTEWVRSFLGRES